MKILVTTDLSANSKGGIRFALQLAQHYPCELTFFYAYHVKKPSWNETTYLSYEESEQQQSYLRLEKFISEVAGDTNMAGFQLNYYVQESLFVPYHIIQYAQLHLFDFICISRRGAGWERRLFGSVSSALIKQSTIPVLVIPPGYRRKQLETVLYASDLANFEYELKTVLRFTDPFKLKVDILHFILPSDALDNKIEKVERTLAKLSGKSIKYHPEKYDLDVRLIKRLAEKVEEIHPSLLVMFTHQQRSLFERLFLGSNTSAFAALAKWPMLVFPKELA